MISKWNQFFTDRVSGSSHTTQRGNHAAQQFAATPTRQNPLVGYLPDPATQKREIQTFKTFIIINHH